MTIGRSSRVDYVLDELKSERARLTAERDKIQVRMRQIDGAIKSLDPSNAAATARRASPPRPADDDGPQSRLRRLLATRGSDVITAKVGLELLEGDGWESASRDPVNVVRTALAQMERNDEVVRLGRGEYRWIARDEPAEVVGTRWEDADEDPAES